MGRELKDTTRRGDSYVGERGHSARSLSTLRVKTVQQYAGQSGHDVRAPRHARRVRYARVDRHLENHYCGALFPLGAAAVSDRRNHATNRRPPRQCYTPEGDAFYYMSQMQDLMSKPMPEFREGSIVTGRILEIRPREVLVDIGYKSEGIISSQEFEDIESLEIGDEVDVLLERLENDEGMVVLSKEKAAYRQNWNKIASVFQGDGLIKGKVKSVVKGGLMVNIGVEAFLPASQIDIVPPKDLQQFVGNTYDFKIVKINDDRKNVVLSRRELIEQERS